MEIVMNKELEALEERLHDLNYVLSYEEIEELRSISYEHGNSWCPLSDFFNDIELNKSETYNKNQAYKDYSPIRELHFGIRMTLPYWVSVHFVRHHIGVNHYVQTQRNDRQKEYDRNEAPQGQFVTHIMSVNAQELIFMAHKRLCAQASRETRQVMKMICDEVIKVAPYMKDVLVPLCEYRNGVCEEMFPCGKYKKED